MSAGQDLTWIANAASNMYAPNLTLVSTGVYKMTDPGSGALVSPSGGADVYWNGVHLTPGLGYAISGAYLTFLSGYVPAAGDDIRVQFDNGPAISAALTNALSYVLLAGVQNGVNSTFTIPAATVSFASVFRNGQLLSPSIDYVRTGTSVTFSNYPPLVGDVLGALYIP